ncbi:MAG: carbon monoxide dehydrogenase subunit G [Acidobacteriota bacterium]
MRLAGEFLFHGPREEVWELLLDPEVLAATMPGTKRLERVGEDEYRGSMHVRVGPVSAVFSSHIALSDKIPPESYSLRVRGKAGPGFVQGEAQVRLEAGEDGTTLMKYQADLRVGGLLASVGQRLLDSVGKGMVRQSLEKLNQALEERLKSKRDS